VAESVTLKLGSPLIGQIGTIYFVACKERYIKIGFVGRGSVVKRVSSMQVWNPFELKVIRTITPAYWEQAIWLHQHFNACRVRGEWFHLCEEMLTIELPPSELARQAKDPRRHWRTRVSQPNV
jgi:hypothetical protein